MAGVSQLAYVVCVLGAHLAMVTAGEPPTCPPGQFAYLVPDVPRLYLQAGRYVCRVCRYCADGQELVRPCEGTNDTQCGGCIREKDGFVYDEGTHSCQHKDVIAGLARPEDFLTPPGRAGEKFGGTAPVPAPAGPDRNSLGVWVSMAVLAVVAAVLLFLLLRRRGVNVGRGKKVTTEAVEEQRLPAWSDSSSQTASPFLNRRDPEETVPSQLYNNSPWKGPGPTGGTTCTWDGSCYTQPREGYV